MVGRAADGDVCSRHRREEQAITISDPSFCHNRLLGALPAAELAALWPQLERVPMPMATLLQRSEVPIEAAYFPLVGSVSMIAQMQDGAQIGVGLIGCEGMLGLPLLLGAQSSTLDALVQVEGEALHLSAASLRAALARLPSLQPLLLRCMDAFHLQVAQMAACNGRHQIEQRLARWLLMTHDRAEDDTFPMTQEFLSRMLGVQRPGVTLAVGALTRTGLVRHARGVMHVLDRRGLEASTCECYGIVRRRYDQLWTANTPASAPADGRCTRGRMGRSAAPPGARRPGSGLDGRERRTLEQASPLLQVDILAGADAAATREAERPSIIRKQD